MVPAIGMHGLLAGKLYGSDYFMRLMEVSSVEMSGLLMQARKQTLVVLVMVPTGTNLFCIEDVGH